MSVVTAVLVILVGYGLGCITTAYYLIRLRLGDDIRQQGSGNVGARNAGRLLGPVGFATAFVGDVIKGAAAVWLVFFFELNLWALMLTMVAVVVGHIWPVQLGFRGGKGLATALGVLLVLDIRYALLLLLMSALVLVLARHFTLAGLIVVAAAPVLSILVGHPLPIVLAITSMALLILAAHRTNICALFKSWREPSPSEPS
jgi:glycerol-3-phosphate acyltransferase PlsY